MAVEFVKDRETREKDFARAAEVARRCLQNGLYLQLHAYMLRVAIPYGTLASTQRGASSGSTRIPASPRTRPTID